jgi:flavorubredoxin
MKISDSVKFVGVNDRNLDLFEGQYPVPEGMAYNSYLVDGGKIAVLDSVDEKFVDEWLLNLEKNSGGKKIDYLIVSHMEPDHSAGIFKFMEKNPDAKIVATAAAFKMISQFFGTDFADRRIVAAENSTLDLGNRTLTFLTAPMVHWPEVMMTYDSKDKLIFSADAFGKFGANDTDEEWDCEAARYYFGIVGKYGAQVQSVLKKISSLEISAICPLHGPVIFDVAHCVKLYDIWSSYSAERDGVFIAYASVYGHTKKAAEILAEKLREKNVKVEIADLCREDISECVENSFKYSRVVFASVTYNTEMFPAMKNLLNMLVERNFQNRKIAFIENGSWAPASARTMKKILEPCKNLSFAETTVTIKSALSAENESQLESLAQELC